MNHVHVIVVPLHPPTIPTPLEAVLTPAERDRRDRFVFARDRCAYTVCRGALRHILAEAVSMAPDAVTFREGPYGKPALVHPPLPFNVSHSGDMALIAVCPDGPVGVDIERERPLSDLFALARRHFSPTEQAALAALPTALHVPAFFRCWSRKEAFIKAIGLGLHFPLHDFDVSLDPREPAQIIAVRDRRYANTPWTVHDLDVAEGYSAALVTQGPATITVSPFELASLQGDVPSARRST